MTRSFRLDTLRGLAVALMAVDHLAFMFGYTTVRETLTRAAMPLFFVLGGHLVRRLSWRLLWLPVLGAGLQVVVPWSGAGPLLLTFSLGAVLVFYLRELPAGLVLLVGLGLALGANGYAHLYGVSYDPRCLVALMALGALVPRVQLESLAGWVPSAPARLLAALGRYPLSFYAGHLLVLAVVFRP